MSGTRQANFARGLALLAAVCVAGCTSTQDVLGLTALQSNEDANVAPASQFPVAASSSSSAPISTDAKVRFAPVVGAPGTAAGPLATRLNARANQRGIGLVGPEDASATHVMKGYFSAISDAGETTVIYVWDVMDNAGTRVHRIQGQAKGTTGGGDGWNGVQPATMEAIADQTVDQLAAWLSTDQG